ncbi:hypothetical protein QM787_04025 [Rhodococcus ruber]|uniref:HNH endonuclease n=1 Tax=Rhodococcus ruber TaxID=1830 RepID=A0A098BX31_9NOCA|nr:hypothetical protein [Rhodococcus ruber]MCD2127668.1 hypothetical protein [Rhodococcus ruber]MCZ4504325.1 hypothetical protein [Rhodococcus ruber]MCZ4529439.1 hypothetical protein [Rhodococcus ruber]MCZ4620986.1 hypothetical protein [Rhodococcus ruber]MDI9967010.1 hypothetical protein [Rhodococcus ruber]
MSAPRKRAASTTARGLGWSHQQQRARLLQRHVDGSPCWWCGRPMFRDRTVNFDYDPASEDQTSGTLAADHSHARATGGTKADRLLHGLCNKQRGDGSRDHLRPAVTGGDFGVPEGEQGDDRSRWCLLDW